MANAPKAAGFNLCCSGLAERSAVPSREIGEVALDKFGESWGHFIICLLVIAKIGARIVIWRAAGERILPKISPVISPDLENVHFLSFM